MEMDEVKLKKTEESWLEVMLEKTEKGWREVIEMMLTQKIVEMSMKAIERRFCFSIEVQSEVELQDNHLFEHRKWNVMLSSM
jgi:hypothetical protein